MNADGSEQTNLTNNPGDDDKPTWSPDGSKIAFTSRSNDPYSHIDIHVMNADGTGETNLTNIPTCDDFRPVWSPNDSRIAFVSLRGSGHSQIYVMNADGSEQTQLTSIGASAPAWLP